MQAAEDADILLQAVEAWLEEATGGVPPWEEGVTIADVPEEGSG